MAHVFVNHPSSIGVKRVLLDGEEVKGCIEADDRRGFILRYATHEEEQKLIFQDGWMWPQDRPVILKKTGEVVIEF